MKIPLFKPTPKLVLASKSPRRQQLIQQLGFPYRVVEIEVDENYPSDLPIEEVPVYLAKLKADAFHKLTADELLITADTIVIHNNHILEKPLNNTQAKEMLSNYSGTSHKVVTGVCLTSSNKRVQFACETTVTIAQLTDSEINYYVENYQTNDKAGAYAIQEWFGLVGVASIQGDFYNVMGLPVSELFKQIKEF